MSKTNVGALRRVVELLERLDQEEACRVLAAAAILLGLPVSITDMREAEAGEESP